MRCEVLIDPEMAKRGARMLDAMIAAAPMPVRVGKHYKGGTELLMVYGTGHPVRRQHWMQHKEAGGRVIGWDLGYWNREQQTMRLTIDHDHPQALIRPEDPGRFATSGIVLRDDSKAAGRVLIVGMSAKANRANRIGRNQWESRAARLAKLDFPDRQIVFKTKRDTDPPLPAFQTLRGPIEDALRGASLVICRHSNVAVDACIAGVPVRCEDGAAYALYGKKKPNPTAAERLCFLQSLAHWQYTPDEAALAWTHIIKKLKST